MCLIDGYVLHQVLDTSAGCQEFSGMRQGICTMAQACSNMCSTTHLHLEEFASMSQTSISVTFWPSIQRQQSACKMFHFPFLWWLYTALLPELTRISIAIPPHSGNPSEVLFLTHALKLPALPQNAWTPCLPRAASPNPRWNLAVGSKADP